MKKYISFGLWGDSNVYGVGAVKNIEIIRSLMPSWVPVIYYDHTVPAKTISKLSEMGCFMRNMTTSGIPHRMMWRFLTLDLGDCERFISRDCDSRITQREIAAIADWEASKIPVHIIRDHPWHSLTWPMLGGMWGATRGFCGSMEFLVRRYPVPEYPYGYDQDFLEKCLWPKAKQNCLIHTAYPIKSYEGAIHRFLPPRTDLSFIGERLDENDAPNATDRAAITLYEADLAKGRS